DGGGMRGYSSLLILRALMEKIIILEQNPPEGFERTRQNYLPCHYFDYIGGTSTGGQVLLSGILSIMLGRLRMSVDDAIEAYEKFAEDIF
ncbi:hypothetical protein K432DRAFT_247363, partial [Lepidopterella palustris CBS 459.81]